MISYCIYLFENNEYILNEIIVENLLATNYSVFRFVQSLGWGPIVAPGQVRCGFFIAEGHKEYKLFFVSVFSFYENCSFLAIVSSIGQICCYFCHSLNNI